MGCFVIVRPFVVRFEMLFTSFLWIDASTGSFRYSRTKETKGGVSRASSRCGLRVTSQKPHSLGRFSFVFCRFRAGSVHFGGCLSLIEIVVDFYCLLRSDPKTPIRNAAPMFPSMHKRFVRSKENLNVELTCKCCI